MRVAEVALQAVVRKQLMAMDEVAMQTAMALQPVVAAAAHAAAAHAATSSR